MKRYTKYTTSRKDFDKIGWSGSSRKKIDDIDAQIKDINEINEIYKKNNMSEIVYKFVDNETNEIIRTNA